MFSVCLCVTSGYSIHFCIHITHCESGIHLKSNVFIFSLLCTSIPLQFLRHLLVHPLFSAFTCALTRSETHCRFLFLLKNISFTLRKYCIYISMYAHIPYSWIITTNCHFKCVRQHLLPSSLTISPVVDGKILIKREKIQQNVSTSCITVKHCMVLCTRKIEERCWIGHGWVLHRKISMVLYIFAYGCQHSHWKLNS